MSVVRATRDRRAAAVVARDLHLPALARGNDAVHVGSLGQPLQISRHGARYGNVVRALNLRGQAGPGRHAQPRPTASCNRRSSKIFTNLAPSNGPDGRVRDYRPAALVVVCRGSRTPSILRIDGLMQPTLEPRGAAACSGQPCCQMNGFRSRLGTVKLRDDRAASSGGPMRRPLRRPAHSQNFRVVSDRWQSEECGAIGYLAPPTAPTPHQRCRNCDRFAFATVPARRRCRRLRAGRSYSPGGLRRRCSPPWMAMNDEPAAAS